ncbi:MULTISPECIES: DUF443 family protein [unclassified Streptococcus]|uniref:DUF443 family protein n=1 Tax=unclassified Streptococcus TaxID=2608887 RepID=UPI0020C858C4|nr:MULTISPECIES: DUF443 family protein [unclassified Streptococcus]MCP8963272.1 DUF443 family protein [Streptococcus sp. CF8_St5-12]MCP8981172.1 DUF443 family protein [Streptococcus sp. CF8_St5-16]MCP8983205.1 DUF443 family protein [Streptococcus sp. CF8_St5-13]MCP9040195.1 DUF443 family protein [Streptococcus sp. CF8_St5-11]
MPSKIERLPKMNFRYHLLKVDGEWYLMEVDRPIIITYFLPWFVYFIPHKAYQLTEDEVGVLAPKVFERDKKHQSLVNNKIGKTSLGLGVTSMLLARAFPIEKYLNFTSHLLNLSLMMLILIFVVGLRIWMGRGEGMQEIVADKTPRKVYCFPEYVKNIILPLTIATSFLIILIALCYAVIINFKPNFIWHIGLLISSLMFFISGNLIFYSPIISFKAKVK